ncbi:MAG: hypothetical protein HY561_12625 [Gemmatimonadetes bacterium]|nr:hypothetical protein [Gemmatimonadota bacterium]
MRTTRAVWCVALACACSQSADVDAGAAGTPAGAPVGELASTLAVQVAADSVRFVLHVTNAEARPATLEFPTSQRFDFVVYTEEGAEVWRWSSDRAFAQVLGREVLPAGETLRYEAAWTPGARRGRLVAVGVIPASNRRIEQRAVFKLGIGD